MPKKTRSHKCYERMNICLGLITTIPKNDNNYRQNYTTSPSGKKMGKKIAEKKIIMKTEKSQASQFLFWVIKSHFAGLVTVNSLIISFTMYTFWTNKYILQHVNSEANM